MVSYDALAGEGIQNYFVIRFIVRDFVGGLITCNNMEYFQIGAGVGR
jgi:hypothetical protein